MSDESESFSPTLPFYWYIAWSWWINKNFSCVSWKLCHLLSCSGNTAHDQKEPTPFIIEWIPDILPQTHIGELRVKFEYGHQRNGQIERRPQSTESGSGNVYHYPML